MARTSIGVLTVLVLTLGACSGDAAGPAPVGTPGTPTTTLEVLATDALRFEPNEFTVPAETDITLTLTAGAGVEHDLVIANVGEDGVAGDEAGGDMDHGGHGGSGGHMDHGEHGGHMDSGDGDLHVAHADAGASVTGTLSIRTPGSYEVYCSVPGHRQAGMTARLHVVGS